MEKRSVRVNVSHEIHIQRQNCGADRFHEANIDPNVGLQTSIQVETVSRLSLEKSECGCSRQHDTLGIELLQDCYFASLAV